MLNRARVLFVDDDRAIHRMVAKLLPAFELCSAYDGASGQQLWSVLVKGDLGFAGATAVNVTGDSRDEVLAEFGGPNNYHTQMLLDGVTGRVIWRYGG